MAAVLHDRFWAVYACGYDVLTHLQPYREMMRDVFNRVHISANERVLDAGCGTGNLIAALNGKAGQQRVVGIDFSAAMLHRAAHKGLMGQVVLGRLDLPLPFGDGVFDALTCVNVLYAVSNPSATLGEFRRVLKVGDLLVLVNPKASVSPLRIFAAHLRRAQDWRARLAVVRHLPALVWVGLCNACILTAPRRRSWFFPSDDELVHLLMRLGFVDLNVSGTYANQAWLVVGVRG